MICRSLLSWYIFIAFFWKHRWHRKLKSLGRFRKLFSWPCDLIPTFWRDDHSTAKNKSRKPNSFQIPILQHGRIARILRTGASSMKRNKKKNISAIAPTGSSVLAIVVLSNQSTSYTWTHTRNDSSLNYTAATVHVKILLKSVISAHFKTDNIEALHQSED